MAQTALSEAQGAVANGPHYVLKIGAREVEVLPKRGIPGIYHGSPSEGRRIPSWNGKIVYDADQGLRTTEDGSCSIRYVGERSGGKEHWVDMAYSVRGAEGTFVLQSAAGYIPEDANARRVSLITEFWMPRLASEDIGLAVRQIATLVTAQYLGASSREAMDAPDATEIVSDVFCGVAFSADSGVDEYIDISTGGGGA